MWCIGQLTAEYRHRMYGLLNLYQQPYQPEEPVVCVDEKSKQLLASKHPDLPVQVGHTQKIDYEYERKGTRNLFVAVEPLAGWRQVQVTLHRKKADFVAFILQLMQGRYRHARKVHLVVDNLNTHFAKVFVEILGQKRAQELLARIEFHYTPKHGSWLNMAEIEIGILARQCINGRIATEADLVAHVKAWQTQRNRKRKTIEWKFTRQDADRKLSRHYVA